MEKRGVIDPKFTKAEACCSDCKSECAKSDDDEQMRKLADDVTFRLADAVAKKTKKSGEN